MSLVDRLAQLFREPTPADEPRTQSTTDESTPAAGASDAPGVEGLAEEGGTDDADDSRDGYRGDGGDSGDAVDSGGADHSGDDDTASPSETTDAVAVVVQAPPAGVRRYELTVRAGVPIAAVDPDLLTLTFEAFEEGEGVVRARAVDVEGKGRTIEAATPLFVVRFDAPVDPDTVSLDGSLDGHDEEPVPWSRVRLTPAD